MIPIPSRALGGGWSHKESSTTPASCGRWPQPWGRAMWIPWIASACCWTPWHLQNKARWGIRYCIGTVDLWSNMIQWGSWFVLRSIRKNCKEVALLSYWFTYWSLFSLNFPGHTWLQVVYQWRSSCGWCRPTKGRSMARITRINQLSCSMMFYMGMDQYLLIPFLVGWTSIYQLFWCSPGVQGFDTLPYGYPHAASLIMFHGFQWQFKPERFEAQKRVGYVWWVDCAGSPKTPVSA